MEIITLVVIALLCLLFAKTRKLGLALIALILLVLPFTFITVVAIAVAIHFFNKSQQRKFYEPPTLPRND